ncbi:MAG: TRAP transporter substrate-binding protein DctP [Treponema sp.]|jgi:TRAP-type C4-dicarboxylate transport system substrate-binding protein|nr:TRAP transporter substrate-binding protein DctP [Treponema sp.]
MKRIAFFLALLFFLSAGIVYAQRGTAREEVVTIRFASILPRNTEWGRALDRLATEWQQVTNNQVRVIISHDGREGSEVKMFSSLSSNSIQAGLFTSVGIANICPAIINLSVPFLIANEAEFDLVLDDLMPILEARVDPRFVILAWSKGGWVYLFSKEQVLTPADLRRQRIATSPDLSEMNTAFRTMGFTVVDTDLAMVMRSLDRGEINTIYMTPIGVAPFQIHRSLNHMLELPISPIIGAVVINSVTWNKISPAHQQEIIRITRRMAVEFSESMSRTETDAISMMRRDGLSINKPTAAQHNLWQTELRGVLSPIMGTIYDQDIYGRIIQILERSRSGQ